MYCEGTYIMQALVSNTKQLISLHFRNHQPGNLQKYMQLFGSCGSSLLGSAATPCYTSVMLA